MKKLILAMILTSCAHKQLTKDVKEDLPGSCRYTCKILTSRFNQMGLLPEPGAVAWGFEVVMANGERCLCTAEDLVTP